MGDDSAPKELANCYIFKSRLQEYAQKTGALSPDYETVKEGPSHEPIFKSVVIFNGIRYESLPGFRNRKAAEHSAAEVALVELEKTAKSAQLVPTHESGLCKNLVQEYAQKMNYAMPIYKCYNLQSGSNPSVSCTVEIGGIQYVGGAARTKKEAEIKAARIALLAINAPSLGQGMNSDYQYTVRPILKETKPAPTDAQRKTSRKIKPKRALAKKRWIKKKSFHKNAPMGEIINDLRTDGSDLVSTISSDLRGSTAPEIGAKVNHGPDHAKDFLLTVSVVTSNGAGDQ